MEVTSYNIGKNGAVLTAYKQSYMPAIKNTNCRPALLILPGGGYNMISDAEREPIALAYSAFGFQCFTLTYSVGENAVFPMPQIEAVMAIAFMRKNSKDFMIDEGKIAVVGFSAGGHLAASIGVHYDKEWLLAAANATIEEAKPNALVLVYPCITATVSAYDGIISVLGRGLSAKQLAFLDLQNYVGAHTPPSYICHTSDDPVVPVMNSLLFGQELAKNGVQFDMHIFKNGAHGMSLATNATLPDISQLPNEVREMVSKPETLAYLKKCRERFSVWLGESVNFLNDCFR